MDSDCVDPDICYGGQCVEATVSNTCFGPSNFEVVTHSTDRPERELSFLWSEADGVLSVAQHAIVEELLTSIYRVLRDEFGLPVVTAPMRFRVFSDSERYDRCMLTMGKPAGSGPFYAGGRDTIFLLQSEMAWEKTLRILLHEGVHFLYHHGGLRQGALIVNEGTAVFMSTITTHQRNGAEVAVVSPHSARYEPQLQELFEDDLLMDMETFLGLSQEEWRGYQGAYAHSYSIIYFLMELHRSDMRALLGELLNPDAPARGLKVIIEEIYAPDSEDSFAAFVADWEAWLGSEHQPVVFFP